MAYLSFTSDSNQRSPPPFVPLPPALYLPPAAPLSEHGSSLWFADNDDDGVITSIHTKGVFKSDYNTYVSLLSVTAGMGT